MLLYILLIFGCGKYVFANTCEFYDATPNVTQIKDNPCYLKETDDNGACNFTEDCGNDYCYSSWKNVSGKIEIKMKGCWGEDPDCETSTCTAVAKSGGPGTGVFFCCCDTDFCNADFKYEPSEMIFIEPTPSRAPVPTNQTLRVLLYTLVPIVALSLLVIVCYWLYKKKKQPFDNIDVASLETPTSCITTTTANTTLLSPGQAELKFPQLIEMKARGRFGCVWKAQLPDRYVAVKIFYAQDKQSWLNEQEILNTDLVYKHPNVLHIIGAASRRVGVETELWLITDFHELGSLADFLKVQTMSLSDALKFSETMAIGLSFLHEDILCGSKPNQNECKPAIAHRDFKSKNVLITGDMSAVIADFGLAAKFEPGESTGESHGQVGTRRYMAPEVLEGAINFQRDAFLRIDMYAFGLVLWEIVTRCSDIPGGSFPLYFMPYEPELGQHPSLEQMQDFVVERKQRPKIEDAWRQRKVIGSLCETIEECWDHDAEARLSAGCVEERIHTLRQHLISSSGELPVKSNLLNDDLITNTAPLISPTDTELQVLYIQ
ncbi:activin receptor type-2B-like [Clavelina lepadiformis]|uniref:activin receptor type-2B-like n=1 Tax=Clavelina lepadiformis TaxID=159417 RepID=UPI004042FA93